MKRKNSLKEGIIICRIYFRKYRLHRSKL